MTRTIQLVEDTPENTTKFLQGVDEAAETLDEILCKDFQNFVTDAARPRLFPFFSEPMTADISSTWQGGCLFGEECRLVLGRRYDDGDGRVLEERGS